MKSIIIINLIVVVTTNAPSLLQEDGESNQPIGAQAEVSNDFSEESTAEVEAKPNSGTEAPTVVRKDDTEPPAWYREGDVVSSSGDHNFLVYSIPSPSAEESDSELKDKLVSEVKTYIEENILKHVSPSDLPGLTKEYIDKSILAVHSDRVYSKPSLQAGGPMYTSIRQITIDKQEVDRIKGWESQLVVRERSKEVGLLGGIGLAGMTVLSGLIGLLARREKAKLKG